MTKTIRSLVASIAALGAAAFFSGCFEDPVSHNEEEGNDKLFVVESDYTTGRLQWAALEKTTFSSNNIGVYSDAAVRCFGGFLYVIERYGADNIMKFNPAKTNDSGICYQEHLGDGWNPQDIEFVSETKAYVSCQGTPKILIFNPKGGTVTGSIDISAYTFNPDSNSSPHAADLQLVGTSLYAMLQRRNGFNPGAPTLLLKINTSTDSIVDTIALKYKNGYAMAYADNALYVSNPGDNYTVGDGAIEKVDLATKTVTTIIDEDDLGGNPNEIVHKSGSRFYVTNYIGWRDVKVVEIDAQSRTIIETLPDIKDAFGGIFYDKTDELLYVGERDTLEWGVRKFSDNRQVGDIITSSETLPPSGLVVVRK